MMRSVTVFIVLALTGQAHTEELEKHPMDDARDSMDELADKLVDKLFAPAATLARAPLRPALGSQTQLPGGTVLGNPMKSPSLPQAYSSKLRLRPKVQAAGVGAQAMKMQTSRLVPSRNEISSVLQMAKASTQIIKETVARTISLVIAMCASVCQMQEAATASNATYYSTAAAGACCGGPKGAAAASAPGFLGLPGGKIPLYLFEDVVKFGGFKMGLPGLLSVGVFLSPLDIMQRILKEKDVGKLPLLPYSAMMTNGALWTAYGLLKNAPPIWAPNVIGLIMGTIYSAIYVKHCPENADWLPSKKENHALVAGGLIGGAVLTAALAPKSLAINILGLTAQVICVIMFGGPLAAVGTIIKEESTRSLPLLFTLLSFANCGSWLYYGLVHIHDPYIYIPNALGFALSIFQIMLFARYGVQQ